MDSAKFTSLVSPTAKKKLASLLGDDAQRRKLIYDCASDILKEDQTEAFEAFVLHPGFEKFLQRRKTSSLQRLEKTLQLLFSRMALEINGELLAGIAGDMSANEYRAVERSYFIIPVDPSGFAFFEKGFVQVGEQNRDLLADYLFFCGTSSFLFLRKAFSGNQAIFSDIFQRLIGILLAKKSGGEMEKFCELIQTDACLRFIGMSIRLEKAELFILNLFTVFYRHKNPDLFFSMMRVFSKRYATLSGESTGSKKISRREETVLSRLFSVWEYFYVVNEESPDEFREFLRLYGSLSDDFSKFVWELVFSLEAQKIPGVISLFVSTSFVSLRGFYGQDMVTLKFLVRHILAALVEMNIRNLIVSLYRLVLKLFLTLKVERQFLKRRAVFFEAMKTHTSSRRMEAEVIRLLFFEYIYIALGRVKLDFPAKMTKFADELHAQFCRVVDEPSAACIGMSPEDKVQFFLPLMTKIRSVVWKSARMKFVGREYWLDELSSAVTGLDLEDSALEALEQIAPEDITFYYESAIDIFRTNPERMPEAIRPDFWHRVDLVKALPFLHATVLPLVGSVEICEGKGGAYTNGKMIFLPAYINYFRDSLDPLLENRNLTYYVSLALHEAGHIIAGTFRFNIWYYLSKLERPDVFKAVHNLVEDYRIESFLVRIRAHPQCKELLDTTNEYMSRQPFKISSSLAVKFLLHIFDAACDYYENIKTISWYQEMVLDIHGSQVNTGRFRNMKSLCEYATSRLKNLNTGNPLAAYPLTRELYEIMKHWPEADLLGILDPEFLIKGRHEVVSGSGEKSRPLTQEELEELYREYDENPRAFLERHELPVYEELLPAGTSGSSAAVSSSRVENYITDLLDTPDDRYNDTGTIDFSRRTKADDRIAEEQLKSGDSAVGGEEEKNRKEDSRKKQKKPAKRKSGRRKNHVYSIDAKTRSRTKISEIREFEVRAVDSFYLKKFKKWEYLADRVYRMLAVMLPTLIEDHERSMIDGEVNMEMLIEILSDRSRGGTLEFLDLFQESTRSLEVVIGIDTSYSTSFITVPYAGHSPLSAPATGGDGKIGQEVQMNASERMRYDMILDVEKAFAMIFGRALSFLTNKITYLGFNSVTSTNVYRASTLEAVSSFSSNAGNRDGDFIRYVKQNLSRSSAEVKYFFLISDGQPESVNYSGKEALDDTLVAMRETINEGIRLIYFNVDMVRGAYFDEFQKEATYAEHFSHPEDLLPVIPEMVRKVVRSIQ